MSPQQAELLLDRMLDAFAGSPKGKQVRFYLEKLERLHESQSGDLFDWLIDNCNSRFFPSLSEIAEGITKTRQPEYMAQISRKTSSADEDIHRALLRQEWLIALPDADYEAHCNALRAGDMDSADRAYRHGKRALCEAVAKLWHDALTAAAVAKSEHDAVCARLADPWLWPQEMRQHAYRAKHAIQKRGAA